MCYILMILAIAGQLVSGEQDQQLALSAASSRFSQRLYQKVALNASNIVYSPYSLYSLLSMTSLGAKGKTAQEMEKTLDDTSVDALVQDLYEELIKELNSVKEVVISTVNGIFINPTVDIKLQFTKQVELKYGAITKNFDLSAPEGPEKAINDYIADATKNLIKNVLSKEKHLSDPHNVKRLFTNLTLAYAQVKIPKFTTETTLDLIKPLKELGIIKAFGPGAEFPRITSGKVHISQVIHKARIDVTETGTTAAAATIEGTNEGSHAPIPEVKFVADHPFLYFIRDKRSGLILFQGKFSG